MSGGLDPVGMSFAELAEVLTDMADHVRSGDSWEGSIEWLRSSVTDVEVRGAFRVGNLLGGQGGMRLIGRMPRH